MTVTDPVRPRAVPAIRDELNRLMDRALNRLALNRVMDRAERSPEPGGFNMLRWEGANLAHDDIRLAWVSEDMCGLAVDVAATLPDDLTLDDLPRPLRGMAIFAHPIEMSDAMAPGLSVRVDGIHWGPITIGDPADGETGTAIGSLSWSSSVEEHDRFGEVMGELPTVPVSDVREWWPIGRSEWMDTETITDVGVAGHAVGDDDATVARYVQSAVEDRRLFAAVVSLMAQERYVDVGTWRPRSKSAKRRLGDVTVDVVTLRRTHPVGTGPADDSDVGVRAAADHRTWVAPYMRMQPYGPGSSLRRLQLVAGHVRGPDDAPFRQRSRVWALRH